MSVLPVYTYDHPILRKKLKRIEEIDEEIVQLALQMHETMKNAEGIGLAANQVGRNARLIVVDVTGAEGSTGQSVFTMINPTIDAVSPEEVTAEEGCLSLPDLRADVKRPEAVQVTYFDTAMNEQTVELEGLASRVTQHEIDHLNGIYFFDHLSPVRKGMMKRRLLEIKRGEIEPDYPLYRD
jgi:peptide deformylase